MLTLSARQQEENLVQAFRELDLANGDSRTKRELRRNLTEIAYITRLARELHLAVHATAGAFKDELPNFIYSLDCPHKFKTCWTAIKQQDSDLRKERWSEKDLNRRFLKIKERVSGRGDVEPIVVLRYNEMAKALTELHALIKMERKLVAACSEKMFGLLGEGEQIPVGFVEPEVVVLVA